MILEFSVSLEELLPPCLIRYNSLDCNSDMFSTIQLPPPSSCSSPPIFFHTHTLPTPTVPLFVPVPLQDPRVTPNIPFFKELVNFKTARSRHLCILDKALILNLWINGISLGYPIMVILCSAGIALTQALILKFKSAHIGYRDQSFRT